SDRGRIGTGAAGYKRSGGMQTIHIGAGRDGVTKIDTRSEAVLADRLHVRVHAERVGALRAAGKSGDRQQRKSGKLEIACDHWATPFASALASSSKLGSRT